MYRCTMFLLMPLVLAACAGSREGKRGELMNPLQQVGQAPGLFHHLPVLQTDPAPLGPALDAYPIVEPPEVKQVWIAPHDNAFGDRVGGHYVYVLYRKPRFAPMPNGVARIPISPPLHDVAIPNPMPGGTLAPHDAPAPGPPPAQVVPSPRRPQRLPSPADVSQSPTAALMEKLHAIKRQMQAGPQANPQYGVRPEDQP